VPQAARRMALSSLLEAHRVALELLRARVFTQREIASLDTYASSSHAELIEAAGGQPAFGGAGQPSRQITPQELLDAAPDRLVICPCGYDLAAIERETAPGERILVLPLLTGLEALSGRAPALPEISVLPGVLERPDGEGDAIAYLKAHPVSLVVTDDREWPAYGRGAFGEDFGLDLAAWIESTHERVATVSAGTTEPRTLTIWRRTEP